MILWLFICIFQEIQALTIFGMNLEPDRGKFFRTLRRSGSGSGSQRDLVDTYLPSSHYFTNRVRHQKRRKAKMRFDDPLVDTYLPPYFIELQKPIFDFGKFFFQY